ncbi:hypothetical protein DSCO28_54120 [Desulfosarcina ovata subsp. sediminis]|uniref:Uncharacterized protein n=1 Tax=Desulfosarcina ovata subsp. sediminis TaxID=885957 RepID=A0A5K7ZXF1_9BACT|nr:hypothetical protein DSCO28_54120 [Desulfosarcina ovata subsp. sediminis]
MVHEDAAGHTHVAGARDFITIRSDWFEFHEHLRAGEGGSYRSGMDNIDDNIVQWQRTKVNRVITDASFSPAD